MEVTFVIAGRITREYVLPPSGLPLLDSPGGSALYACGGLLTWTGEVGLLARVGEDFPRVWLKVLEGRGVDVHGIKILPRSIDVRDFLAYDAEHAITRGSPVAQFARRKLPFPKSLLGYQPQPDDGEDNRQPEPLSPTASDIPASYRDARAVHLCPMDFVSHHQLISAWKASGVTTLTLDPSAGYMHPSFLQDLRAVLGAVTAFVPSEDRLRSLFWGETYDLWEMLTSLGSFGCEVVVVKRAAGGQAVYDAAGQHRWEIPAYPARVADPTGVGHAFGGGFLAGFRQTYDPLQAALYGNVAASLKVEGTGAFYSLGVLKGLAEARLNALRDLVREI
jgi:sugar/nucleoside kinase (ribokinase family)